MTGAVIALTVKNPILAVPLAFLSHFVQDLIPHYGSKNTKLFGRGFNTYLIADFLFSLCLMALLGFWFPSHTWIIWGCMIAAASPDLMWAYYKLYIGHIKMREIKLGSVAAFHQSIQWKQTPPGAIVEAVWFVSMGAILISLR